MATILDLVIKAITDLQESLCAVTYISLNSKRVYKRKLGSAALAFIDNKVSTDRDC